MLDRVKICHMTSAHQDGDIRIFHKECVSLSEVGYDVHLVIPNTISRIEKGVQIHSFELETKNRFQRFLKTAQKTYQVALSLNADIYHFHDPELLPYGLKLAKKGKKVIYDAHEDVPRQILGKPWIPAILRPLFAKTFEVFENFVAKRLSFVVVSTPTIKSRFLNITPNTEAICNYPILEEIKAPLSWESRKDEICYIGGITEIRGIRELIDALPYNSGIKLNLAGNYSPASFRDELTPKDGWKQVVEHGYVGRQEIVEILRRSKVGMVTLYPQENYLDSLPIKMYEYMFSGIPVIASNFPLWEEIISENQCGLCIDPKNPIEIGSAIQSILSNEEQAKRMGENGRKAVLEKYNWSIEKAKLNAIYLTLHE